MTMLTGLISYPIPAFQNLPIESQFYIPSRFVIINVTLGQTTIITTSIDHDYVIGQEIRLIIPSSFGCFQLNEFTGFVLSIPQLDQIEVSIDSSRNVDQFILSSNTTVVAQVLAIGDVNTGAINPYGAYPTKTYIPGSFINISPL